LLAENPGGVHDPADSAEGLEQAVGPHEVDVDVSDRIHVAAPLHATTERDDLMTRGHRRSHDVPADESRSTCYEDFHVQRL
jgi:hypothetical protein